MGDVGASGRLWVSIMSADPRRLSPSDATQYIGGPMVFASSLQTSMTVWIKSA